MSWLLDFVPVVGTVKNTVECVDCLLHGDGKGALSKGTQAVIGGALDVATFGTAGSLGKIVTKGAVKGVAISVGEKAAINVGTRCLTDTVVGTKGRHHGGFPSIPRGSSARKQPNSASQSSADKGNKSSDKEPSSTIQAESSMARGEKSSRRNEKSSSSSRNHTRQSSGNSRSSYRSEVSHQDVAQMRRDRREPDRPKEKKNPSRRGEHVINNGVLSIYEDIVRYFVSDVLGDNLDEMVDSGRLSERSAVLQAIESPVSERIANMIQNQLIVHMDGPFTDTNAIAYGEALQQLREVLVSYMEAIFNSLNDTGSDYNLSGIERNVRDVVEDFIAEEYYIDETALEKWRSKHRESGKIDEAIDAVDSMLRKLIYDRGNDTVITWVKELRKAFKRRRR